MIGHANASSPGIRPIRGLPGTSAVLFLSDGDQLHRSQTLRVLEPYLKTEYQWSNTDFAWVLICVPDRLHGGQTIAGRWSTAWAPGAA